MKGSASGLFNFAHCYACGIGCEKDYFKAYRYFKMSAEKGLAKAFVVIGEMELQGIGNSVYSIQFLFHNN